MNSRLKRSVMHGLVAALVLLQVGCATGPNANPKDPLEPMNRSVTKFNDGLDDYVLKPVATSYRDFTPEPVQKGVRNFFRNIGDMFATVNNGLQLKGRESAESLMRVVVNTTFGIYGIFDFASDIGLKRNPEDFGQTLGYWGVPEGPYLVLPVFGPSTVRDASTMPVEFALDPVMRHEDALERGVASGLRVVDKRATLLATGNLLNEAALDKYSFTRDAYLQYRRNQVYDGNPPDEPDLSDPSASPVPTK